MADNAWVTLPPLRLEFRLLGWVVVKKSTALPTTGERKVGKSLFGMEVVFTCVPVCAKC